MTAASGSGIPQRDEDSGLHDIKNLASSQRMRLSRRSTQNPIIPDDDVLASSSAGWKAVALPEPARMVSLPELAELPSKAEVKAREKAQKAADKAAARDSKKEMAAPVPAEAPVAAIAAAAPAAAPIATAVAPAEPVAKVAAVTPIGSRVAPKKGSSTKIIAIAGIGLAAAAGVTIFVMTNKNSADKTTAKKDTTAERSNAGAPAAAVEQEDSAKAEKKAAAPAPAQIAADTEGSKDSDKKDEAAAGSGAAEAIKPSDAGSAAPPPPAPKVDKVEKPTAPTKKAPAETPKPGKVAKEPDKAPEKPTGPAAIKTDEGKKTVGKGKPGEPDFDALLKEAGVKEKADAPKLEKKQLTMGEFKTAMAGITGVAQKCYAGTPGTAMVKVSIAPNGKVSGVQVTGAFAGTPVGTCVENAVRGLSFPAWDGPPQSFGYSYLLAE